MQKYYIGKQTSGTTGAVDVVGYTVPEPVGYIVVTGHDTNFTSKITPGRSVITVAGTTRLISAVSTATSMTVDVAALAPGSPEMYDYTFPQTLTRQAYSAAEMVSLAELGLPEPKCTFQLSSQSVRLGDGAVRGAGWPVAEWRWGFLTRAQRDALRAYCAGASASVYVMFPTLEDEFSMLYELYRPYLWSGTLIWPEAERTDAGRLIDFAVRFQALSIACKTGYWTAGIGAA